MNGFALTYQSMKCRVFLVIAWYCVISVQDT